MMRYELKRCVKHAKYWKYKLFSEHVTICFQKFKLLNVLISGNILGLILLIMLRTSFHKTNHESSFGKVFLPKERRSWKIGTEYPKIEIFSAPPPVDRDNIESIRRAIASWRSLEPRPKITLLGQVHDLKGFAKRQRVSHDPLIDHNFLGRPIFSSLIHRANLSMADITVFVNADILLFPDFVKNIIKLYRTFPHFFAVAARYDIDKMPSPGSMTKEVLRKHISSVGSLHNYGGMDFWAWTTKGPRLVSSPIPTFTYARGRYDNWLMHEVISNGKRPVVDLSETVISVHERHSYNRSIPPQALSLALAPKTFKQRVLNNNQNTISTTNSNFWSRGKLSNFELFMNIHLSLTTGSYREGFGTTRHAPWKMSPCEEKEGICLLKRIRQGLCHCEYTPIVKNVQVEAQLDEFKRPKTYNIVIKDDTEDDYKLPVQVTRYTARNPAFGLPLTFLDALASVIHNGTVIVTAVSSRNRHMLMNWVCQMRKLNMRNFIVAALDKEIYRYAFIRGVAVYYEDSFETHSSFISRHFGIGSTQHQKSLERNMKARVTSRILRLGYDVVWSSCDILFIRSPLKHLIETPGDLLILSDPREGKTPNAIYQLTTGFYMARSSSSVITAFDMVLEKSIISNWTENKSFYSVFCGENGEYRQGPMLCAGNGVVTQYLPQDLFISLPEKTNRGWKHQIVHENNPALYLINSYSNIHSVQNHKSFQGNSFNMFDAVENVCQYRSFSF